MEKASPAVPYKQSSRRGSMVASSMPSPKFLVRLPAPPSHNQLHKWIAGRVHRSPRYREWLRAVRDPIRAAIAEMEPGARERLKGEKLAVYVTAALRSNRDLDNVLKPVLDALEEWKLYKNDSKVKRIVADFRDLERHESPTVTVLVDVLDQYCFPRGKD